jgi:hypothetical protein
MPPPWDIASIRFTQSSRRHRVGKHRALAAIRYPLAVNYQGLTALGDHKYLVLGEDLTGRVLEIILVETLDGIIVIHVMDIRRKHLRSLKGDSND